MRRRTFLKNTLKLAVLTFPLQASQAVWTKTESIRKKLKKICSKSYFPGEKQFSFLKKIVNQALIPKNPKAIVQAENPSEFQKVISFSAKNNEKLRVRSAGHSFAGFCMGSGIVLDIRKLNKVKINEKKSWIEADAGLNLDELRTAIDPKGYVFPTGSCPTVGLSGYILGGGHSKRSRYLGLAADCVKAMDVVLANGKTLHINSKQYGDLFWAILGGGGETLL